MYFQNASAPETPGPDNRKAIIMEKIAEPWRYGWSGRGLVIIIEVVFHNFLFFIQISPLSSFPMTSNVPHNLQIFSAFDDEDVEQNKCEIDDKSGLVTGTIWMKYFRAGGWLSGNAYIITALACQVLRVYMDLWLSQWTDQNTHTSTNEHQDVGRLLTLFHFRAIQLLLYPNSRIVQKSTAGKRSISYFAWKIR